MWDVSEMQKVKTQIQAYTCQRGRGNALGPFISRPDWPVENRTEGTETPDASSRHNDRSGHGLVRNSRI